MAKGRIRTFWWTLGNRNQFWTKSLPILLKMRAFS
jgi:hypothetical protein